MGVHLFGLIVGGALAKRGLRDWIGLSTETLIADARQDRLKPDVMLAIHFWTGVAFLGSQAENDNSGTGKHETSDCFDNSRREILRCTERAAYAASQLTSNRTGNYT